MTVRRAKVWLAVFLGSAIWSLLIIAKAQSDVSFGGGSYEISCRQLPKDYEQKMTVVLNGSLRLKVSRVFRPKECLELSKPEGVISGKYGSDKEFLTALYIDGVQIFDNTMGIKPVIRLMSLLLFVFLIDLLKSRRHRIDYRSKGQSH